MTVLISRSDEETRIIGEKVGRACIGGEIMALTGTLAAGKTVFAKGVAEGLEIADTVTSPTFTVVQEYSGRLPLYHVDAYRLASGEDFIGVGAEDFLYAGGVTVIEWSERVKDILPEEHVKISFTIRDDGARTIAIEGPRLEKLFT